MKKYIFLLIFICLSVNVQSQNKKSLLKKGNKLFKDSLYNDAEIKYRKSLEKDQDYFGASYNLANSIYKQERYDESSSLYKSLKDNAKNDEELSVIHFNEGNSLLKEKKTDLAIESFKEALRKSPNDEDARFNLAYALKMKEQEQENKDQENKDQENKDQENKDQENKKDQMSKEDAKKMLEALEQKEKTLQEKLQKKKVKGQRVKILKDW